MADVGDGYHGSGLEAYLLYGSGAVWDGEAWDRGYQVDLLVEKDLLAQALWDEVSVYPGAGEVFTASGAYGVETPLRAAKFLRGQGWGLVLDGSSAVELREVDEGIRGSGTPDSLGFFVTGSPYGRGNREHELVLVSGGGESGAFLLQNRMLHRRVFRELASSGQVSLDWLLSGLHVRASVDMDGQVRVGVRDNRVGGAFMDMASGISAEAVCVRWDLGRERIWLLTLESGSVKERFSDDLGASWSMATTLASGAMKWPTMAVHPDGRRFVYWVNGGSVDGVIRDRSGAILATVSGARSGVDDAGLACAAFDLPRGGVQVEMVTVESGSLVASVSSDGVVFG